MKSQPGVASTLGLFPADTSFLGLSKAVLGDLKELFPPPPNSYYARFSFEETTMTGKELIALAMDRGKPPKIPVMCQLTIGHILLNTEVTPEEFNFTNEGYVRGLLQIRDKYDFDGILIHKPGREEAVWDLIERVEKSEEGVKLVFPDGGAIELRPNDDPYYYPPEDYTPPNIEEVNLEQPIDPEAIPESLKHWWLHKGLHWFTEPDQFPDFYFTAIDTILRRVGDKYSIHGETKAPSDYLLNFLGMENALLALLTEPERCHRLLEYFTRCAAAWCIAQVQHGCDAIKISSPYAGGGFISREMYEEFIVPYERELARAVHQAGAKIYTHTCGAIGDRLDLMVETEIDGIETLDPPPLGNTDLEEAKKAWGHRIFFKGNIDSVNTLLRKGPEEVRKDALYRLRIGSPGGGYILSSACSIAPAVKPENILAMVEAAREFEPEY